MSVRDLFAADLKLLATAKASINTNGTINFDFGTPDDINLAALSNYKHGDRVLVVFTATTAGTTNVVSFSVQDAPDNAGTIGTPATASIDGVGLAGGTGDQHAHTAVRVQSGRPWLRCRVTSNGTTDTFVATAKVFAVGRTV